MITTYVFLFFYFYLFKVDRDLMCLCMNVEIQWKLKYSGYLFQDRDLMWLCMEIEIQCKLKCSGCSFFYFILLWRRHVRIQQKWNILIEFFYMKMLVRVWWKMRCRDWFFYYYYGNKCWKSNRKWDTMTFFYV